MIDLRFSLGPAADAVRDRLHQWKLDDGVRRLWERDTTIWAPDPPPPELADRLGWLDLPDQAHEGFAALDALRAALPFWMTDLVLLGMGGSSLAPEVIARTLQGEGLPLTLLDTTHPRALRELEWVNPANAVFVVASKSGTTIETLSLFRHFWSRTAEVVHDPGSHFIAVTDPGSSLAALADDREFRATFEAPADVGGRFSALSPFGLVPAALMGVDVPAMVQSAIEAADGCREGVDHNPGFELGAALGELARAGRDKVTFVTSERWSAFPDWAEQLIAESTGKDGVGIVPVAHEPELDVDAYGPDRVFVGIVVTEAGAREAAEWGDADHARDRLDALEAAGHPVIRLEADEPEHLGALFFLWEVAVAMAGAVLEIHPFNQPDVQLAKSLAKRAMSDAGPGGGDGEEHGEEEDPGHDPLEIDLDWETPPFGHAPGRIPVEPDVDEIRAAVGEWLDGIEEGDYVGLQVYTAGANEDELQTLQWLRELLSGATGAATTLGYGPRFLHSTGQLHKGGADNGVFLQIVDDAPAHVHVPETDFTFRRLIRAQAKGDLDALRQRERRVLRVRVAPGGTGLERLVRLIEEYREEHA
jgi:transaldolase/glucose-6-phosphate isomerase